MRMSFIDLAPEKHWQMTENPAILTAALGKTGAQLGVWGNSDSPLFLLLLR
jgi:hypothetical protein